MAFQDVVKQKESDWAAHYNAGKFDDVASLYTADGQMLGNGYPPQKGRAAISAMVKSMNQMGGVKAVVTVEEAQSSGDLGYEKAKFDCYKADGSVWYDGKIVHVWKKEGNDWKIYLDMWNSNVQ